MDFKINKNQTIRFEHDNWDDFGFKTSYDAYYIEVGKSRVFLGSVKLGNTELGNEFYDISEFIKHDSKINHRDISFNNSNYFSLGQSVVYYKKIMQYLGDYATDYFLMVNDIAYNQELLEKLNSGNIPCFYTSLLRNIYLYTITQFSRIINGESELTTYQFIIKNAESKMSLTVEPEKLPPSNIHVLIGSNGMGKTWLLYNILSSLIREQMKFEKYEINYDDFIIPSEKYIKNEGFEIIDEKGNGFAGIIGVSFSVFDDALYVNTSVNLNGNQTVDSENDELKLYRKLNRIYKYIGVLDKDNERGIKKIKSVDDFAKEFRSSLKSIKIDSEKRKLLLNVGKELNGDGVFYKNDFFMMLKKYLCGDIHELYDIIEEFKKLSSGHMIIILTLTLLTDYIQEKTVLLIDEPETHLHPPLLSAYIRALSFLLKKRNAVAIIATHSPIVLQEVPKSCVKRIQRNENGIKFVDIKRETFAENIETLTQEVFGLETVKTGFYKLIQDELENSFDGTIEKFGGSVGFLGRVLIQSLIKSKEQGEQNEED